MRESGQASQLQLLFIELRVGLARSAIQSTLLLNGGAAVALLLFMANILGSASQRGVCVDIALLKWALAVFAIGLFLGGITFVNAYAAQGAIASGQSSASGNGIPAWARPDRGLARSFPRRLGTGGYCDLMTDITPHALAR